MSDLFGSARMHRDDRGHVVEVLRGSIYDDLSFAGQIYVTSSVDGSPKGNHYHNRKSEFFFIVDGEAEFKVQRHDTGQLEERRMMANNGDYVHVPPGWVHAFRSVGASATMVVFVTEEYDENDSDTIPHAGLL